MRNEPSLPFLELAYRNPTHPGLALETFSLSELRQRLTSRYYDRGQRLQFHLVILYTGGEGCHEVDFMPIACRPGTLIHVRPGQVQRYVDIQQLEAQVVFFTSDFLMADAYEGIPGSETGRYEDAALTSVVQLSPEAFEDMRASFDVIRREYRRSDGGPLSVTILRHQLRALMLQWAREAKAAEPASGRQGRQQDLYVRFRQLVEQEFASKRRAEDYALLLGCSPRTLNRVSHTIAGKSAKDVINARVLLEAQRLLAYTTLPVARIAGTLGFSEPTNFIKFFRREAGVLPGAFRKANPFAGR
jgi:AraC-type DNA-binding domain-containing proteins